jgi:hypothetical protein
MTLATVFALSLSSLLYEITLTRWFAVAQWSHLAPLVIGIAMLGSAAAGVLIARAPALARARERPMGAAVSLLAGVSTLGSFILAKRIPLDFFRLPVDGAQLFYLLAVYLLLALPFFFAGLATCAAYARMPARSGAVAGAAMTGSAAGAALPALLFPLLGEGGAIAAAAIAALAPGAAAFVRVPHDLNRSRSVILSGSCAAVACCAVFLNFSGATLALQPSPYKALSQLLMMPGNSISERETGLWGSLSVMESPQIRFAPGLSLSFTSELPGQAGIFTDGDDLTTLYRLARPADSSFARQTLCFSGYALVASKIAGAAGPRAGSCLIVQRDGGLGIACAIAAGSRSITAATGSPGVARRIAEWYHAYGVDVVSGNPRATVRMSRTLYDVIHVENWGPLLPGMASLSTDALLTMDAFQDYWRRLSERGVIIIGRMNVLPPSDSVRLLATARDALTRLGVETPSEHLAVARSWDVCTILVSRRPFRGELLEILKSFCQERGFDLDWYPGIAPADTGRFIKLERPWYFEAYEELMRNPGFIKGYFLDVAPETDDRPFPSRFLRWLRVSDYMRSTGGMTYRFLASGELVAVAGLLIAVFAGLLLMGGAALRLPVTLSPPPARRYSRTLRMLFFASVGCGYLFAEIAFLDALGVLFASPSLAIVVTLGGMLAFSGIGGLCTARLGTRFLPAAVAAAAASLLATAFALSPLLGLLLPFDLPLRIVVTLALLAVPATILGVPFPLALREPGGPGDRALAWAANGAASVIASAAAPLLAAGSGVRLLFVASAAVYAAALALTIPPRADVRPQRNSPPGPPRSYQSP